MSRLEMALFKAVLYCQKLEFRGVPPDLCVLEACRPYLYDSGLPVTVFVEQDEAQAIDQSVSHCVQGIALFIRLQILELCQVLYHVIELLLVVLRPVELCAFVC